MHSFVITSDINENYRFQEILGQGAFSQVRRAIYIEQQKPVAVKIIEKRKINSTDLQCYLNECQILFYVHVKKIQLQHPNIIQIYEVYQDSDYFYIVMELMEGGQLLDKHNINRYKTQQQIAQVVAFIADALGFCHSENIVHRDIKPQNILWTSKGQQATVKIADFGFAKMAGQNLMTTACGTPMFFSPEILSGKPYDNSIDFWSLGVITYILLSGRAPFQAEDQHRLFDKIKMGRIQFPERQWSYISSPAKDFVLRLLQKSPSKRYQAKQIKNHPWITSKCSVKLTYSQRVNSLLMYAPKRQMAKMSFLIEQTIHELQQQKQSEM